MITAAHVVGHWPFLTHPRVLIAGQDLPAKVIKQGSFETTDLALLSVDEAKLPISLRLRRNPLCSGSPKVGTEVIDVFQKERPARASYRHYQLSLSFAGGSMLSSTAQKNLDQACLTQSENASSVS